MKLLINVNIIYQFVAGYKVARTKPISIGIIIIINALIIIDVEIGWEPIFYWRSFTSVESKLLFLIDYDLIGILSYVLSTHYEIDFYDTQIVIVLYFFILRI